MDSSERIKPLRVARLIRQTQAYLAQLAGEMRPRQAETRERSAHARVSATQAPDSPALRR